MALVFSKWASQNLLHFSRSPESPEYMLNVISFLKFPNYFLHNLKHKAEKVYYIYQHNMFGPL